MIQEAFLRNWQPSILALHQDVSGISIKYTNQQALYLRLVSTWEDIRRKFLENGRKLSRRTSCGVKIPIIEHTKYINYFMQGIST